MLIGVHLQAITTFNISTAPPTVPNNLMITSITNTSISLMWEKPDVIGRDDYYFAVKYRTDSSLKFITAFKVIDKSNVIAYTLHNLTSYTSYEISVTAVNGVSDQDWYNDCIRTATITAATLEGGIVQGLSLKCMLLSSFMLQLDPVTV